MAVVIGIDPYINRFTPTYDNKTPNPCSSHEIANSHRFHVRNDVCQSLDGEKNYEKTPRLHIGFKFIGGDRNFGFGKCITTEATHGIR